MLTIIGVLLVIWLALVVIGLVFKAVFWLAILGGALFVATAAYGWLKRKTGS